MGAMDRKIDHKGVCMCLLLHIFDSVAVSVPAFRCMKMAEPSHFSG